MDEAAPTSHPGPRLTPTVPLTSLSDPLAHCPATAEEKDPQEQRLTLKSTLLQAAQPSPGQGTSGLAVPGGPAISWAQGPLASQITTGLHWNIAAVAVAEDPLQPARLRSFGVPDYPRHLNSVFKELGRWCSQESASCKAIGLEFKSSNLRSAGLALTYITGVEGWKTRGSWGFLNSSSSSVSETLFPKK